MRIAVIQNGDFVKGLDVFGSTGVGMQEPYFGMRESVGALMDLVKQHDSLILSLEARPHNTSGKLSLRSIDPMSWIKPGRVRERVRAAYAIKLIQDFKPTHLLLRCGGQIGLTVAKWAAKRNLPTLTVFANAMYGENKFIDNLNRAFMQTLNAPNFTRVANYKPTAAKSMVNMGLDESKVIDYAFGGERTPDQYKPRKLDQKVTKLVFAGRLTEEKGVLELCQAVKLMRERGHEMLLNVYGTGPLEGKLRELSAALPESILVHGQVGNDTLFDAIRSASFVCVPSRSSFVEGMPQVLTEALAARTPVLLSNCRVFKETFKDEEGVVFFHEGEPESIVVQLERATLEPYLYDKLSDTTERAFSRVRAKHTFSEILAEWANEIRLTNIPSGCKCC